MAVPVSNEAGTAFEGSQSLGELLQPLCSVGALVSVEMRSAFKALCTLQTLKGSLSMWMRWWRFSAELLLKLFPHSGH